MPCSSTNLHSKFLFTLYPGLVWMFAKIAAHLRCGNQPPFIPHPGNCPERGYFI